MQGKIEKESVGTCAWIKEETMERHPCPRLTARPPHSSAGVHVLYCTLHWTCIVLFFSPSSEGGRASNNKRVEAIARVLRCYLPRGWMEETGGGCTPEGSSSSSSSIAECSEKEIKEKERIRNLSNSPQPSARRRNEQYLADWCFFHCCE